MFLSGASIYAQVRITSPTPATPILGGSDVEIRWTNTSATASVNDSVRLEVSINGGVSWEFLANARGGSYTWRSIPTLPMQQLRLRATELGAQLPYSLAAASGNLAFSNIGNPSRCENLAINVYPNTFWKPDGRQVALVSASWNELRPCQAASTATVVVRVFDTETGAQIQRFSIQRSIIFEGVGYFTPFGYGLDMTGAQQNFWSADGRLFSWWQDETTFAVWNADSWTRLTSVNLPPRIIGNQITEYSTAWKPDGTGILMYRVQSVVQPVQPRSTQLSPVSVQRSVLDWQIGTVAPIPVQDGTNSFGCLAPVVTIPQTIFAEIGANSQFSNNREMVALACANGGINIVNLQTRQPVLSLSRNDISGLASDIAARTIAPFERNMAWSPDDRLVAIWGGTSNNNDDNTRFTCNCNVRRIMIVNVQNQAQRVIELPYQVQYWTNVAWSRDGNSLVITGDLASAARNNDAEAAIIEVPNGDLDRARLRTRISDFEQRSSGTQFGRWNNQENFWNPDNTRFAGGNTSRLDVWDGTRGDLLQTMPLPTNADLNRTLSWSPDGTKVLSTTRMRFNATTATATQQGFSAVLFSIPPINRFTTEPLSVAPVAVLDAPESASTSFLCGTEALVRIPLTNRGLGEMVVSGATVQFSSTAALPLMPAIPGEFRIVRVPDRIAGRSTDTLLVGFSSPRFARLSASVSVRTNAINTPSRTILVEGRKDSTGLILETTLLDIPEPRPNEFIERSLQFRNTGTVPITFSRQQPFATGRISRIEDIIPSTLQPQGIGFIRVRVLPPANLTNRISDTFQIFDACGRPTALTVSVGRAAVLDAPDTVNLGSLACGTAPNLVIPLRNTGNQTLLINGISVLQGNAEEFPLQDLPNAISPNMSGTLELRVSPSSIGTKLFTVELQTNAVNAPRKTITVRLMRDALNFRLANNQVSLATEFENTPTSQTVRIINTGTVPLRWQTPINIGNNISITAIDPPETPANGGASVVTVLFRGASAGFLFDTTITLTQRVQNTLSNVAQNQTCEQSVSLQVSARVSQLSRLTAQVPAMNLLCETSSQATLTVLNVGTSEARIERISVQGANANEFRLEGVPSVIARGQSASVQVRFTPTSTGAKQANIVIQSNAENPMLTLPLSVRKDSSGIAVMEQRLDFGVVAAQTERTLTFSLTNTGSLPQQITVPQQSGDFTLVSVVPNPIPANTRAQGTVRFTARTGGAFTQRFVIRDACSRESFVECTARVAAGDIGLQARIEAAPGRDTEIPIFLRNRSGSSIGTRLVMEMLIGNASLLEPTDAMSPVRNTVQNGSRTLEYATAITSDNENEPVFRIRLRGLLGNDSTTTLRIPSFLVGGVPLVFTPTTTPSSQVVMRGLNQSGGTRLFFGTPSAFALNNIFPNPVTQAITLHVEAQEDMNITAKLLDMLGREHAQWKQSLEKGIHMQTLSLEAIPAGVYFLHVQYPCASESGRVCTTVRELVIVR
jgi:hypothetical protein